MSDPIINVGDRVAYTTTGRFPKEVTGAVTGLDNGWVIVKGDDGKERRTRPSPLRKI